MGHWGTIQQQPSPRGCSAICYRGPATAAAHHGKATLDFHGYGIIHGICWLLVRTANHPIDTILVPTLSESWMWLIIHCKLYGHSFEVSADHIKDALVMKELESSQLLQARKSWNLHMKRLQSFLSDHQQRDGPVRFGVLLCHGWHLMAFVGWQMLTAWAGTLALRVWAEASLPRWPCWCTSWRRSAEDSWIVTGSSSLSGVRPCCVAIGNFSQHVSNA
jgi:hypothetical protein